MEAPRERDLIWLICDEVLDTVEAVFTCPLAVRLVPFTVTGDVKRGGAPGSASVLATAESKPLALIVADMSKWSNNYVAEMLVKNLSAEAGVKPATMPSGMQQLEKFLEFNNFTDVYKGQTTVFSLKKSFRHTISRTT